MTRHLVSACYASSGGRERARLSAEFCTLEFYAIPFNPDSFDKEAVVRGQFNLDALKRRIDSDGTSRTCELLGFLLLSAMDDLHPLLKFEVEEPLFYEI